MLPVCDDTCREVAMDPKDGILVCKISGHCFERLMSPDELEPDPVSRNFLYLLHLFTCIKSASASCAYSFRIINH